MEIKEGKLIIIGGEFYWITRVIKKPYALVMVSRVHDGREDVLTYGAVKYILNKKDDDCLW